ncbi:MAG TPA: Hsp20 family protein [Gemmatimonadales bacterium]|nr:Hsp20 family protein [Gemmatimonadales bacterium]
MKTTTAVTQRNQPGSIRLIPPEEFLQEAGKKFDAIARRAFELFEYNGHQLGHDVEDWFKAEAELFHPVHLDIAETDNTLTVKAEVPGFTERDLKISVEPHRLTIAGKRETHEEKKTGKTLYTERCSDDILRVVDLPKEVDPAASGITATCAQGVLTITLPEAPTPKVREIRVET